MLNNSDSLKTSGKRHIVFHIGPHKTGTTYIQKMCVEQRSILAESGICYPREGIGPQFGHHQIVRDLKQGNNSSLLRALEECPPSHTVVFSSEDFDSFRQLQVKTLRDALPQDVMVSFVYFIRRQHELLISSWQERTKSGGEQLWSEHFLKHIIRPFASPLLNHYVVLKHYGEVFGFENVHLVDYNYLVDEGTNVFDFLMEYLGVRGLQKVSGFGKIINKSISSVEAEILRALNSLCKIRLVKPRHLSNNPKIRSVHSCFNLDQFKKEKHALENIISQDMVNLEFNNLYFASALQEFNQQQLSSCIRATPSSEGEGAASYQLPASSWIMKNQAVDHLEKLFQVIIKAAPQP